MQPAVVAVLVTFQPDLDRLGLALRAVQPQVDRLIVVDNSEHPAECNAIAARLPAGVEHLPLGANLGIAAAFNRGCQRVGPTDSILLLDQDSVAAPGMVAALAAALARPNVAACGPLYLDEVTGRGPVALRAGQWGWRRRTPALDEPVSDTETLISSGTLLSAAARREIGDFDESLFIDHVDTDWCLRARRRGYRLRLVAAAGMAHRLGDGVQRLPWRPDRPLPRHPARRLYFIARNGLRLMRRPWATSAWCLFEARRLLAFGVLAALDEDRWARLASWLTGLRDGLQDKGGPRSVRCEHGRGGR